MSAFSSIRARFNFRQFFLDVLWQVILAVREGLWYTLFFLVGVWGALYTPGVFDYFRSLGESGLLDIFKFTLVLCFLVSLVVRWLGQRYFIYFGKEL